ncbi:TorF family putative porin [Reyranella soli]|uniref:Outer membrane protein beta-barrel domain-containing protein n=1 Tax=Reyranella soli TaxID=1230389 RepID=A0A512NE68_9HYPH|nr:TorF family putative porin [Reyranella soli]GEP57239.1 hypothetical protein RSO01_44050 [Reyranella soli]
MNRGSLTALAAGVGFVLAGSAAAQEPNQGQAQTQTQTQTQTPTPGQGPAQATETPAKEFWKAPFGGSWTATFAFATDYSYRGISQTQRQIAIQPAFTYETPTVSEKVPLSAYVGAWGSNVYFGNTNPTVAEIDLITGLRAKALDNKLTFDLGYIRYNYLGGPSNLFQDFNEFGLVVGYDFGLAQLQGAVRYSPNFFGNSGIAWYKWGQLIVPLSFIKLNENVSFKLFGTLGNQYVERFTNYGIGYNNYWDWQVGLGVSLWGVDLSIAYVDTNLDQSTCAATMNCDARAIFTISKTF